ncbi:response regulator [Methyloraptor flagellatus]|uniref:Response regulator n=1 Tax=Methyloraptor flagellatus TaxID=3162530 RepID=A0AAU7XDI3_9HYPH
MRHHRAFGVPIDQLDVVVVDDSKPMQTIFRTILHAIRVGRVRVFDNAEAALQSMILEPPHLLITDWNMKPTDGLGLIRMMRDVRSGPVATVPAILVTAHATRQLIEAGVREGTHYIVAKPVSPQTIQKRIEAVVNDQRRFVSDEAAGVFRLEGHDQQLAAQRDRWAKITGLTVQQSATRTESGQMFADVPDLHEEGSFRRPKVRVVTAAEAAASNEHAAHMAKVIADARAKGKAKRPAPKPGADMTEVASKPAAPPEPTRAIVERLGGFAETKPRRPRASTGQSPVPAS